MSSPLALAGVALLSLTLATTALAQRALDTFGLHSGLLWAETITADELREHAFVLASDSLQGRETGTAGQRLAAQYLALQMDMLGLPKVGADYSYEQPIAFEKSSWDRIRLSVDGDEFRHLRDYYAFPAQNGVFDTVTTEVVFLGYGIDEAGGYSDYRDAGDVRGKVAVVLSGEPFGKTGRSAVTGTADTSAWSRELSLKRAAATAAGLDLLLVVEPNIQRAIAQNRARIIDNSLKLSEPGTKTVARGTGVVHVSPKVFDALAGKRRKAVIKARKRMAKKGRSAPVALDSELDIDLQPLHYTLDGSNVLGYIRGSDPALADEVVVVSAHYDHLGARGERVFNGADDNASGTSTVLEIAEALAAAQRAGQGPRRSVLCLLVSGEEKGLLGSEYYAANPVFPLENTVADINIDMIGRYDEAHADSSAYIYVIGAGRISPDLDSVTRAMNDAYARYELDYTYDAADDPNRFYYRSDHYNFAKNGVPSVFFFSGVHADYHRPTDTPDKLDYDKMAIVGRHAFLIAWNLANRPEGLNRKEEE